MKHLLQEKEMQQKDLSISKCSYEQVKKEV